MELLILHYLFKEGLNNDFDLHWKASKMQKNEIPIDPPSCCLCFRSSDLPYNSRLQSVFVDIRLRSQQYMKEGRSAHTGVVRDLPLKSLLDTQTLIGDSTAYRTHKCSSESKMVV